MRILVADDDLVSRLAMEDVLRQCGAPELVLAEDGARAWQHLQGDACFDLLCLDVRMPPPDGLELVARVRAAPALRRVPALLISSTTDRDSVLAATRSDLQGFIVKPVGPETVTRIQRVLAQLDGGILEDATLACARLRIDAGRHARYVAAFAQQLHVLAGLARELARVGDSPARPAFVQKADACRTAALTLGAPRLEQLVADALALEGAGAAPAAGRCLAQAQYWLDRVSGRAA
jgi:two-component system chemotaxis response regulator CheY